MRLPLDIVCTKSYESAYREIPAVNEDKFESLLTILQRRSKTESDVYRKYIDCTMKQFYTKFVYLFPSCFAFYIHVASYIAIERMTFDQHASDTLEILTNQYLSSTDPHMILPFINGFGLMFCYAFINQYKSANFKRRRGNVYLGLLFIPWSMLFISSAFHFYILGNMLSIVCYQKLTMQHIGFQKQLG